MAVADHNFRQQPVTRGREKGEPAHPRNSTGSGGNDISAHLCVWSAAAGFSPFQQDVTNREERKTSMPENIDPDAGLRAAGEQTRCRKQTGKAIICGSAINEEN